MLRIRSRVRLRFVFAEPVNFYCILLLNDQRPGTDDRAQHHSHLRFDAQRLYVVNQTLSTKSVTSCPQGQHSPTKSLSNKQN